jgi:hypothetical protein
MPDRGLDEQKLDVLRQWGSGLERDRRQEVAAAGRAIMLLIEEIERLHVLLWDRRLFPGAGDAEGVAAASEDERAHHAEAANEPEAVETPLRRRLRQWSSRAGAARKSTDPAS